MGEVLSSVGAAALTTATNTGLKKSLDLIMDKKINPKLEKMINKPKDYFLIQDAMREYLSAIYIKYEYMNTIAFLHENKKISELYIPVNLIRNGNRNTKVVIDENVESFINANQKILIVDTAGMGKSTIVKYLTLLCIDKNLNYPFVIELRNLVKNQDIDKYIISKLENRSGIGLSEYDIKDLLRRGDFIFFLDGYDEIANENKENVSQNIIDFIDRNDSNKFIITSRDDDWINCLVGFDKYHIQKLNKAKAYELIKKYDNNGEISESLINELETGDNIEVVKEMLDNPLLVSLLYSTYRTKGVLHYKKHIFYRQVFEALFEKHDTTKGIGAVHQKKCKLDIDDFNNVMSALGYLSIKNDAISFEYQKLIALIEETKKYFNRIEFNSNYCLDDLLHTIPIFTKEGNEYRWVHKSFAEYFAANFICNIVKEKNAIIKLINSANNKKYINILDFCYDMDNQIQEELFILNVVNEYVAYYQSSYISSYYESMDEDALQVRKYLSFVYDLSLIKMDKKKQDPREIIVEAFSYYPTGNKPSYFTVISKNNNLYCFFRNKPLCEIVKLLYFKNIDIFKTIICQDYPTKFINKLPIGKIDIVEDESNLLNEIDNFKSLSSCILHAGTGITNTILDYDKCLMMKRKIEENIRLSSKDDFLL